MITPSNVDFTYKKYGTIPPAVLITHNVTFNSLPFEVPGNLPSFLRIYDTTLTNFKLELTANADSLNVGVNSFNLEVLLYDQDLDANVKVGDLLLNITVSDTIILNVTPNNLSFAFEIGASNPVDKLVSITSENSWSVTKTNAWLTLSAASGSNSGSFNVGVVTTGLSAGAYTDTIVVNDGVTTKNIAVSFTVTEANTGTDYLYVNPSLLKFGYTVGGTIPPAKSISLNASDTFTASVNEPFLELPTTSGIAGASIIQLAVKDGADLTNLTEGTYFAVVTITVSGIVRTVSVELEIYNFTAITPSNTELLFTAEENILALKSSRLDTFMQINFTAVYNTNLYSFPVEIPFFKGGASRDLGIIPKRIIGEQNIIGLANLAVFQPYLPVVINLEMHEKELFTEAIVATSSLNNLRFIKGAKPNTNFLSEIARTLFLSTKATLCFSVLSNNVATASIFITGAITKEINVDASIDASLEFYTLVLPLATLANFTEGHEINITFLNETVKVVFVDDAVDHSMVYWENENGCFDALELRGQVTTNLGVKRTTASFRLNETTSKTKTLNIKKPVDYTINTGVVHTDAELEMITNILYSKNVYLQTQNQIMQVIPKTNKIPTYQSLPRIKSLDINFTNAEE